MTTKRYFNITGFRLTTVCGDTQLALLHGGEIAAFYTIHHAAARNLIDGTICSVDGSTTIEPIRMVGGRYSDERKPTLQARIGSDIFTTYIFDEFMYSKLLEELAELR